VADEATVYIEKRVIEHGLQHVPVGSRVAVLADVNFLWAQKRYALHTRPEFERLLVLMRRTSLPAGRGVSRRGDQTRQRVEQLRLVLSTGRAAEVGATHFAPQPTATFTRGSKCPRQSRLRPDTLRIVQVAITAVNGSLP
jgi:hypothetical protein